MFLHTHTHKKRLKIKLKIHIERDTFNNKMDLMERKKGKCIRSVIVHSTFSPLFIYNCLQYLKRKYSNLFRRKSIKIVYNNKVC